MQELNFPFFQFRTKSEGNKPLIFDAFRKKWVVLTPEEWVRQHVLRYLHEVKDFPIGLTAVEASITINGLKRRCDIIYYNQHKKPVFLVECKAPEVELNQAVFDQVLRYNLTVGVPFLFITNGISHLLAQWNESTKSFQLVSEIPHFQLLSE